MPVYGPTISPTTISTKPTGTSHGGSSAPSPGSTGAGLGIKLTFKKGGSASSRADGCARKGKTRGKIV